MADIQEGVANLALEAKAKVEEAVKAVVGKKDKKSSGSLRLLRMDPQPEYIDHRIKIFDEIKAKYDAEISAKERKQLAITLKDGTIKQGLAYEITPFQIASEIGKSFAGRQVISKVNGELWDLTRPLEEDTVLEFLDFDHPEGKQVFWHSSAHVLGEACECHYGCHLSYGPPTEDGFFYDMSINNGEGSVSQDDFTKLEEVSSGVVREKQDFVRLEMTKEELLKMFAYNKYRFSSSLTRSLTEPRPLCTDVVH